MVQQFTIHLTFPLSKQLLVILLKYLPFTVMLRWLFQRVLKQVKLFRLKGKGAPRLRGGSQGDQLVTVKIVTPTKLK